ncbi:MAG: hypothetical protein WD847_07880 [Pirellulales bacterium]
MKGRPQSDDHGVGSDSFLDVVTNIVGILIILVMVVGIRARHAGQPAVAAAPAAAELGLQREADLLGRQVLDLQQQLNELEQAAGARLRQGETLAFLVTEQERSLEESSRRLDEQSRAALGATRTLDAAKSELNQALDELARARAGKGSTVVQVKSYPTPISQVVLGNEAHFQVRGGLVARVPFEELVALCKRQLQHSARKLADLPELTETIGPVQGFRLRFSLERLDLPLETQLQTGHGSLVQVREVALIPVSSQLGEPLAEALAPRSEFRTALAALDPRRTTVTLWTYPDSFAAYRALKEDLYGRGFAVAGRPLPQGQFIAGSPQGSHSAAQ